MTNHNLTTADQLQADADFAVDHFGPNWKDDWKTRRIVDALVEAEAALRHYEDAFLTYALRRERAGESLAEIYRRGPSDWAKRVMGVSDDAEETVQRAQRAGL